jgi:hypothetical protein
VGSQQGRLVKVLIPLGQLQDHCVHPGHLYFDLTIAVQRHDVPTMFSVLCYKMEVISLNTDALQVMGLPKTDEGSTDVLENGRDLILADLE